LLSFIYQVTSFILEVSQVGQALLTLGESMLTTSVASDLIQIIFKPFT